MKIKLPARDTAPECILYIEILKTNSENELGKERPVMFLLPGGPGGNHTVYDEIKLRFLEYTDLVLIDPRGCGISSPCDASICTIENAAKDIEALKEALKLEKFILCGGSFGAMVSLYYATQYLDSLCGLILIAGAPSGQFIQTAMKKLETIGTEEQIKLGRKLFSGKIESIQELEHFYSIMLPIYLGKLNNPVPINSSSKKTTKKNPPYFLELLNLGFSEMLPKYNIVDLLKKITIPTLLLAGENDWINDIQYAYQMKKNIQNADLIVFPNAGHYIWNGIEADFSQAIGAYFSTHITNYYQTRYFNGM